MSNIDIPLLIARLHEPFPYSDIEWRILQADKNAKGVWARIAAYVDSRAIMSRLDAVVGPDCWKTSYRPVDIPWSSDGCRFHGGMICTLSLKLNGEWVSKSDGSGPRDTEPFKSSISDSLKRAAVQWGISRYLYQLPDIYAEIVERQRGANLGKTKGGESFYWLPPPVSKMPRWMLPAQTTAQQDQPAAPSESDVAAKIKEHLTSFKIQDGVDPTEAMKNVRSRIDARLKAGDITDDQCADIIENYYLPLWEKLVGGGSDG